jgi:integration host factor beta subunit
MCKRGRERSVTKRELVAQVAENLGLTQGEVADVVQTMLDTISKSLAEGNRLEIRNFGVFEVKERRSRLGRNPRTGEEVPITRKRVPAFKPGKALKQWVQDGRYEPIPGDGQDHNPAAYPEAASQTPHTHRGEGESHSRPVSF